MIYLILTFIFLVSSPAFSKQEVDLSRLYECTRHFCPGEETAADRELQKHVGFVTPPPKTRSLPKRNFIISTTFQRRVNKNEIRETPLPATTDSPTPFAERDTQELQQQQQQAGEQQRQQQAFQGQDPQVQGVQQAAIQVQDVGGGKKYIPGVGLVSSEGDSDIEPIKAKGENNGGTLANSLNFDAQDKLNAAKAFDTGGGDSDTGGGRSPASVSGAGSGFGQTESPSGGTAGKGGSGESGSLLGSIAKALGSFAGVGGGSDGGGGFLGAIKNALGLGSPNGNRVAANQGQRNHAHLIRDKFGRTLRDMSRAPASGLELASPEEPIFGGMCGHYAAYAYKHRIPYDRAPGCHVY